MATSTHAAGRGEIVGGSGGTPRGKETAVNSSDPFFTPDPFFTRRAFILGVLAGAGCNSTAGDGADPRRDGARGKALDCRGMRGAWRLPIDNTCGVALSPDNTTLAIGRSDAERKPVVVLWDCAANRMHLELTGVTNGCSAVAFAHSGKAIALDGGDHRGGFLAVCDTTTGAVSCRFYIAPGGPAYYGTLLFSRDDTRLITLTDMQKVIVWDIGTGTVSADFPCAMDRDFTGSLSMSGDGGLLAAPEDASKAAVWDLTTKTKAASFSVAADDITSLSLSSDGKRLVSTGDNGSIQVWNVQTGKLVLTVPNDADNPRVGPVATFHPKVNAILFTSDKGLVAYDLDRDKVAATIPEPCGAKLQHCAQLVVSQDGRYAAIAHPSIVVLWDLERLWRQSK